MLQEESLLKADNDAKIEQDLREAKTIFVPDHLDNPNLYLKPNVYRISLFGRPIICVQYCAEQGWCRFFGGSGISWKDSTKVKSLFSERVKAKRTVKISKWVLSFVSCFLLLLSACSKQGAESITGIWIGDDGTAYTFFDDSRFKQSDQLQKQWIWKQTGAHIDFYGDPNRIWLIQFITPDSLQATENKIFGLRRQ